MCAADPSLLRTRFERMLIVAGCVALAVPLAAHAYAGTGSRYVGDDYCAGYIFQDEGLLGGQRWFYMNWGAVPGVLALMALTESGGSRLTPWLPAMVLVAWVAAVTWAVEWLTEALGDRWTFPRALLLAELVVFATMQETPNVIQSAYLRVPMFEYTGPLVIFSAYLGFLARASARRVRTPVSLAVSAAITFVAGCFGPIYVAMQTTALVLASAVNAVANSGEVRARLQRLLSAGIAGSLAALAVVALAPGNFIRQQSFPIPPTPAVILKWSLLSAVFMFLRPALPLLRGIIHAIVPRLWGAEPVWLAKALAMTGSPLTILLLLAVPACLALINRSQPGTQALRRARLVLLAAPVAAFVLVVSAMTPAAYGTSAPPPPRALSNPQFAMTCLIVCWGYAFAVWWRYRSGEREPRWRTKVVAVAAFGLLVGTAAASTHATWSRAVEMRGWAAQWDSVDHQLRAAREAGAREAVVPAIGDVGGVGSIAVDPGDWVNACAARYYGLERITGVAVRR